jgi:hypothetical protein
LRNLTPGKKASVDFNLRMQSQKSSINTGQKTNAIDLMITMTHRKNGCLFDSTNKGNYNRNTSNYDNTSRKKTGRGVGSTAGSLYEASPAFKS